MKNQRQRNRSSSVAIAVVPWTLIVIFLCFQCRKEKTTRHLDEYFKVSFFTGHGITEGKDLSFDTSETKLLFERLKDF